MANLTNPKMEVTIKGDTDIVIDDLYMSFDISKDLEEEPNTAELSVYLVGPDMLASLQNSQNEEAPIEIRLTPSGKTDLVLAYAGEVSEIHTDFLNPGHVTRISCESQKVNHRAFEFDATFLAGTPQSEIIEALISAVNLPTRNLAQFSTEGIILSHTFNGPAFPSLERFVFDHGYRAYITDGVLNITSVYEPVDFTVFKITKSMLLGRDQPKTTTRNDNVEIEMKTVVESTGRDPFAKVRKKKKKTKKAWGSGTVVEYEGVDKLITGVSAPVLLQPTINPDQIISIDKEEFAKKYYRVQSVNHSGNNETFDEWTTNIEADIYEDTGGDILDVFSI